MATAMKDKKPSIYGHAADEAWGYPFGVDGLMCPEEAAKWLDVSIRQLDRFCVAGKIRKGKLPSGVRWFCRRSVLAFAGSLEA